MSYLNCLLGFFCCLSVVSSFSQVSISGKIVDKNGEPLPFVHLHIENSNIGTISNEDGLFQIATNQSTGKKRIIVSAIGYKTEKIYVQDEYRVISLEQDITTLITKSIGIL